jgi:pimeloyl-ACP methyl ester carboxylesterase
MPFFTSGDVNIHYQEFGSGFPVLLFAPGLMRSSADRWDNTDLKPREVLAEGYRIIAMDQRNAGKSTAPIKATDGWHAYADDAIGLLDHLGLDRVAFWGRCIGPSFAMKVIERMGAQANRVTALIDHAPIGLNAINRGHYMYGFYQWAEELPKGTFKEPVSVDAACAAFCENMFGSDFVFSVNREYVRTLQIPTLVLPGRDLAHPEEVAVETAQLAPHTEMRMGWQEDLPAAGAAVRAFLEKNRY